MGVALAAAAVWAVTLRKVEALARVRDRSREALPSPSPPPPPSEEQAVVGVLPPKHGFRKITVTSGSAKGGVGADGGLRRRETRGEADGGASVANGRHVAAEAHTNGNGNRLSIKDL